MIMNERELIEKWISVFGKGVDKNLIEDHVTSYVRTHEGYLGPYLCTKKPVAAD